MLTKNRLILLGIGVLCASFIFVQCSSDDPKSSHSTVVHKTVEAHYVGAESCESCHKDEYQDWKGSDHELAMAEPNEETVLGDFSGSISFDGVTYKLSTKNGKYLIEESYEGETNSYEVLYTFGVRPLQQYLVEISPGEIQTMRLTWDTDKHTWFHQREGEKIPSHDWLHWTNNSMNWTTMCASCHSTNVKKGFDDKTWNYNTSFDLINVSCEACHGPGSNHIENVEAKLPYQEYGLIQKDVLVDKCASCHARRTSLTEDMNPHEDFHNYYIPQKLVQPFYHADGQILEEDYVYTSFLSSRMYKEGVVCSDCHNPHSNKLLYSGNLLCTQCHEAKNYDVEAHFHHPKGSEGSQCVSCHMDGQVYMGNDYRRDHSFRIPRPDQSLAFGTPNACNSCHTDKSTKWAADKVISWFGPNRAYHFSDDLIPGSTMDENSEKHLVAILLNDTLNPIVQASAVHYLSTVVTENGLPVYLNAFKSPHVEVREAAYRSLTELRGLVDTYPELWDGLRDTYRSTRINAFRALMDMKVPSFAKDDYEKVREEYIAYLEANSDMLVGQIEKSEYYERTGDMSKAIIHLEKAVELDSVLIEPQMNLAILYARSGKNSEAQKLLSSLQNRYPENTQVQYYYALVLSENGDTENAIAQLEDLLKKDSENPDAWYNLIQLYNAQGNQQMAIRRMNQASLKFPNNQKIKSLIQLFQ